jgi:hypothetical protein
MDVLEVFSRVEQRCRAANAQDYLLWPNTDTRDMQAWILEHLGVTDDINASGSRPRHIESGIQGLLDRGQITAGFSIVDICCGDALILEQIKAKHDACVAIGFDINANRIPTHDRVRTAGVHLYFGYIQELFKQDIEVEIDIGMMLNTYRAWDRARLRTGERDLPDLANRWLRKNCRHLVLTATDSQIASFERVEIIGSGEQDSKLVLVTNTR